MQKLAWAVVTLFLAPLALAQAPAAADKTAAAAETKMSQKDKMRLCNKEAKGKKGAERKAFMKECLSAKK